MKKTLSVLLGVLLLAVSAARAQFTYTNLNGAITITGYTGPGGAVTIPATISNLPVTGIADDAFRFNDSLTASRFPTASPASARKRSWPAA